MHGWELRTAPVVLSVGRPRRPSTPAVPRVDLPQPAKLRRLFHDEREVTAAVGRVRAGGQRLDGKLQVAYGAVGGESRPEQVLGGPDHRVAAVAARKLPQKHLLLRRPGPADVRVSVQGRGVPRREPTPARIQ